jgi:hypothetical protein
MQHMYGHVGELKLLVPSFGRIVLAIVNAGAENNESSHRPDSSHKKSRLWAQMKQSKTFVTV